MKYSVLRTTAVLTYLPTAWMLLAPPGLAADRAIAAKPGIELVEARLANPSAKITLSDVQAYFIRNHINGAEMIQSAGGGKPAATETVCSFVYSRLGADKEPVLIASVDLGGRGFCNEALVLGKSGSRVWIATVDGWNFEAAETSLESLGPTGHPYLLVPEILSEYGGGNCVAEVPRLYDLVDERLLDVTSRFPDYYRGLLSRFQPRDPSLYNYAVCDLITQDKLKRLSGIDKTAGFTTATSWMLSNDLTKKMNSIRVLADIGDARSKYALKSMEHDTSPVIAQASAAFLQKSERQTH